MKLDPDIVKSIFARWIWPWPSFFGVIYAVGYFVPGEGRVTERAVLWLLLMVGWGAVTIGLLKWSGDWSGDDNK